MTSVFDGHNDALTSKTHARLPARREGGGPDLPRMRAGGMRGGIFAVFTSSPGEDTHSMVFGSVDDAPGGVLSEPLAEPVSYEVAAGGALTAARRPLRPQRAGGA